MDRVPIIESPPTTTPESRRKRRRSIGAALLALLALLAAQLGAVQGAPLLQPGSSIAGTVRRDSPQGPGVSGAVVSASSNAAVRAALPTGASGGYTLAALPAGTYELSVRPTEVFTTSPDWVYAGSPLLVSVPPNQTGQTLVVQTASVTVTGKLALPPGATGNFASPGQHAWVRAGSQEGQGNTVLADAAGYFKVRVLPGLVLVHITLEDSDWAVPTEVRELVYHAEAGGTLIVDGDPSTPAPDPLQISIKHATIGGKVTLMDGVTAAPAGIPVHAWRLDGSEFEQTTTDASGIYSMNVISGTWVLRAVPESDTTYGGQYYLPAQPPKPVRVISDTAAMSDQNLKIAAADVTVSGSTSGAPSNAGVNGRVYTLYQQDGHPALGPTAPLGDGTFSSLRLSSSVATTYTFGVYFPPDVPYTALGRVTHSVAPGDSLDISIPVALKNSHITGTLRLSSGAPAIGVPGSVWGASSGGGWARTRVNSASGEYDLAVASTNTSGDTWYVRAFVEPMKGYIVQRPRVQQVFLPYNDGGSSVADVDFRLLQLSTLASIHGRITNPDGTHGLPGVRVSAREFTGNGTTAFEGGAITDLEGRYNLHVPPGTYRISAHLGALRNLPATQLIAPAPLLVTAGDSGDQTLDLRFRAADAPVRGLVAYNGSAHTALVRARSEDGAVVLAPAAPFEHNGGNYLLGLKAGLRWTLEAVASEGSDFLRSNQVVITPTTALEPLPVGETLTLTKTATIPDSQVFRFQADQDQLFTLSDGTQLQAPAGAFATGGGIGLIVRPLTDVAEDGGARPLSFGYRLTAYDDATGLPIDHFLRPVTLVIPFTRAQLDALGITIDRLAPSYWDEASASWKPVENVAVLPDDAGGGTVNVTVDHFTDFALLGVPGGSVYLPLVMR